MAQGYAPGGAGGQPQQQQQAPGGFSTFSQMQKAGIPRPPSPSYAAPRPNWAPENQNQKPVGQPPIGQQPQLGSGTQAGGGYAGPTIQHQFNATAGQGMQQPQNHTQAYSTPPGPMTGQLPSQGLPSRSNYGSMPWQGAPQVETAQNMGGGITPYGQPPLTETTQNLGGQGGAQNQNWGNTGQQLYDNWQRSQTQIGANPFNYNNPINQQIGSAVSQHLANPSAYNSQMALQTYQDINRQKSQDYDFQRQQLQDMMARRGLDISTLHGQKYSDLGVEQGRMQADLQHSLVSDAAHQYGSDLSGAISAAMGYGAQDYGQQQGMYNTNLDAQQQQFNQNQQNFQNYVGFGQQDFNNQMAVNQFNANRDDAMNQYLLALMGGIGG